jgi:hypothetical protein
MRGSRYTHSTNFPISTEIFQPTAKFLEAKKV